MQKKTALLFGATGLTGSLLLNRLTGDQRYDKIKVFTRSDLDCKSDRVEVITTRLEDIEKFSAKVTGDHLFCCLGTTIKKAGSRGNFRRVDLEFPVRIAEIASKNRVPSFLVVSSIGADPDSPGFYLRTKGEMERAVSGYEFTSLVILRPSMLLGERKEFRFLEEAGKVFMKIAGFMFRGKLRKYRAIEADTVAAAMVKLANSQTGKVIMESDEIELIGKNPEP
jgi:uncharacterized protein YbjT (DUF2867 family)